MRQLGIIILVLWLSSCAPLSGGKNTLSPAQHRQHAQKLLLVRDIKGATEEMRLSLAGNPNSEDALLYADLLESQGQYKSARHIYKKASRTTNDQAHHWALAYRLALLEASNLNHLKTAAKLAASLPPTDSRYFDLQALLLLKKGQYRQALKVSRQALAAAHNNEERGWAYFHLAQIYYELRVERDTFGSLFKAVNNARGYSLVARITAYWEARRHAPFPQK